MLYLERGFKTNKVVIQLRLFTLFIDFFNRLGTSFLCKKREILLICFFKKNRWRDKKNQATSKNFLIKSECPLIG